MAAQVFKTHRRYIFLWHILTGLAVIATLVGSIVNLTHSSKENVYSASLLVLVALILGSIFWYARWFALRVQDRAIRAEENLRHFVLTGKLLDNRLHLSQVIALRFAPDEEFVSLAKKAAEEGMIANDIKQAIVSWKGDHHRA
jgi:uncharacterized membrane protein